MSLEQHSLETIEYLENLIIDNQRELSHCAENTKARIDHVDQRLNDLIEKSAGLSEEELDKLAERVSEKLKENFYKSVGRTVIEKALILIGVALVAFATGKGWVKV